MMDLVKGLPEEISVNGVRYPIRTDFRRWILITKLFGEEMLPIGRKLALAAEIAGMKEIPGDPDAFGRALLEFASCGQRADGSGGEAVFDFYEDGDAIWSGFYRIYGMDLTETDLHWWKFMALLRGLPADTEFMGRVALRSMDLSRIEDDGVRRKLRRARAKIRLGQRTQGIKEE
jgi:hypothetical protein